MKGGNGSVETGDRFSTLVPGKGKPRAVPVTGSTFAPELNGSEAGFQAKMLGGHLVDGNAVVKALAGLSVAVGSSEVESASPVGFVVELVGKVLNNGDVTLMAFERRKAGWQGVVGAGCLRIGIPGFLGHAPAHGEKGHTFGGSCRSGGFGKALKAEGFHHRQSDHGGAAAEEGTSILIHGGWANFFNV